MICFRQHCPFLQRLHLHGNVFDREVQIMETIGAFHFPSLLHIHVNKLHIILAIQLLDQCPQLRSFSAKIYGHQMENGKKLASITLPSRIRMGLTAMEKLSLGDDDFSRNDFGSLFLGLLLPCCPNLHTFSFDYICHERERRPLDPNWWTRVFASHKKMKRISLQLYVDGVLHHLSKEAVQGFQSLPFFAQLKVIFTCTEHRFGFPHMAYAYSIKN